MDLWRKEVVTKLLWKKHVVHFEKHVVKNVKILGSEIINDQKWSRYSTVC